MINDLIMIMEVDRLIFKAFNTMIAEQFKQEQSRIKSYLKAEKDHQ